MLVTCEHASNRVPEAYRCLFRGAGRALASHQGYDAGALELARTLASSLRAPLMTGTATRLLADLNRHASPDAALSEYSWQLSALARERMLNRWHAPYRDRAVRHLRTALAQDRTLIHVSCHSFTPKLGDVVRDADIGLLYDPRRPRERALAAAWRKALLKHDGTLRIRRNYPYRGVDDGLTRYLRRLAPDARYAGLEIEVNQRLVRGRRWQRLRHAICEAAAAAVASIASEGTRNAPR